MTASSLGMKESVFGPAKHLNKIILSTPMPILPEPEQPLYIFHQKESRAVLPKILSLLFLSTIFYLGILVNISLLKLDGTQETAVKSISLLLLIVLTGIGTLLAVRHARHPYYFYRNRIVHNEKVIYYQSIHPVRQEHFFDRFFKTYALNLGGNFFIRHIPGDVDLESYSKKMADYSRQTESS